MADQKDYVCVLIHGDECINDNDCKNCCYGADDSFFKEEKKSN